MNKATNDQMRDAVVQAEKDYILSLSSEDFVHYVKDIIISRQTDDEIKEQFYSIREDEDEQSN
jgi:hypothetical protein|tara:strand:- start:155 stop:343 length:189 start_codon:yes stop_codon:yes gene_type:complete